MDAEHLPEQIGVCTYCQQPLYEDAPAARSPLAHVACASFARRPDAPLAH